LVDPKTPALRPAERESFFSKTELKILHEFFHSKLVVSVDLKDSLKELSNLF